MLITKSTLLPLPLSSLSSFHSSLHFNFKLKLSPSFSSLSTSSYLPCPPPVCQSSPPTSAYIHLPFCRKRCHYCDFPIIALGSSSSSPPTHNNDNDPRISNYISLLIREIQSTFTTNPASLKTIFFGGGTPSLVPPRLIHSVIHLLNSKFGVNPDAEISIEMDPGTFDAERLREIVGLGVNRVSLGVQAFQEELLRECGRAHGVKEVEEAIEMVKGCDGLENWSLDLISSLPRQSGEMWEESLRRAVEVGPTHVSVYDLQVEQGTKFAQLYNPGEFPLPSETQSAEFYKIASKTLTAAGYNHYEISSYCKNGYECEHNLTYWHNKPFYGFGLGSASHVNGVRFSRPRRLKEYTDYVVKLEYGKMKDENISVTSNSKDLAMDVVMLSLRTATGLDVKSFGRCFGGPLMQSLCKAFRPYVESGHVTAMNNQRRALSCQELESWLGEGDSETGDELAFIRLSDPDGFLLSNELIAIAFGVISP